MHHSKLLCVMLAACAAVVALPARAETRGYVISWFATATHAADFNANCPENRNGGRITWYIRDLIASGYTREEALKIISTASDSVQLPPLVMRRMEGRAIVNGKHVSIYNYPDAVPDPDIETVSGKFAYGFDLGSPNRASKFSDPETQGLVDDQLWRAVGCLETFHAVPPQTPYSEERMVEYGPAWALQIGGTDLSKDGPVTVTLSETTQRLQRNATGEVTKGSSYIIDRSARSYNVFQGGIKDGVLTIKPGNLHLWGTRYTQIALRNVHIRIRTKGDGLVGYWGGYMKWLPFVYAYTSAPPDGADTVGIYHAVKKMADADPDPKTGQNQEISATFRMEAVPAYILDVDGRVLAQATPANERLGERDLD